MSLPINKNVPLGVEVGLACDVEDSCEFIVTGLVLDGGESGRSARLGVGDVVELVRLLLLGKFLAIVFGRSDLIYHSSFQARC